MHRKFTNWLLLIVLMIGHAYARPRWSSEQANTWYSKQPWLVGSNFIPSNSINELEMWQAETFDLKRIDQELGWAESMGMNTMRVFLHDLPWQSDSDSYSQRIDQFLSIASKHGIRPMFVLFDSCWVPNPKAGLQHPPIPGVHNSGWVQSPGAAALKDANQYPRLKAYVQGVVGKFGESSAEAHIREFQIFRDPTVK